jgi:UDP-N-acetyl-D-glucosamine/UDP-N-acetyl-D-galactosamine dehydrogenase
MLKFSEFEDRSSRICIVGLGYVGLPLAVVLNRKYSVIGFDIKRNRVEELRRGFDRTHEIDESTLKNGSLEFSTDPGVISDCRLIIVTVPTPVDMYNIPDLSPVRNASITVGKHLRSGSCVVYESTVYPGVTEDDCVPILEAESGLQYLQDFHVGYSPERVNPGDKLHTVDNIKKVVAADTPETTEFLAQIYGHVITAGIHNAPNIKTAEAAKVIENTQRDLNIALMNELSLIFNRMNINTRDVLAAAGTKWNFLPFVPGLVGGHCIGVDPYYLTFKAESIGYHPEVILAGRRINDSMGKYIAENTIKTMIKAGKAVKGCRVLIAGLTFKENISDIRNTRVIDIFRELIEYGVEPHVYDPYVYREEVHEEYGIEILQDPDMRAPYDAVIVAVKHTKILEQFTFEKLQQLLSGSAKILIDIKGAYDRSLAEEHGFGYWAL